ncbi:hypothetical protein EOL96_00840 [Candidatus Saccharibacteria bacterium]|nr:hypothetical protein [Candidatus Saccharibacteria bacterium]
MLRELKGGVSSPQGQRRARRKRLYKTIAVVVGVFLLLAFIGIVVYVWITGKTADVEVVDVAPKALTVINEPKKIADNQPVGVSISSLTSPVSPGSNVSITIRTLPLAACSIDVRYNGLKSTDIGLIPKNADEYGVVTWSWKVEEGQSIGKWPIDMTCALGDNSGYMRGELIIE